MSDDLVEWLRAQLDEDERIAREASGDPWVTGASKGYEYSRPGDVYAIAHDGTPALIAGGRRCGPDVSAEQTSEHIARHGPARVLAEVATKRRILDEAVPMMNAADEKISEEWDAGEPVDYGSGPLVLRLLAAPYAGRPGWRDEWAA